MQIKVDDAGLIQAFAIVGQIDGGQDFGGGIPDDFEIKFKPGYYKIDGGVITINQDYVEATPSLKPGPSAQDLLNANIMKQVAANTVATAAIMKQLATQVKEV